MVSYITPACKPVSMPVLQLLINDRHLRHGQSAMLAAGTCHVKDGLAWAHAPVEGIVCIVSLHALVLGAVEDGIANRGHCTDGRNLL